MTTLPAIHDRIVDICEGVSFALASAVTPFDFTLQPSGQLDQVYRIEYADSSVQGGLNYSETRTAQIRLFVARKQNASAHDTQALLAADADALLSAIVHDGSTGGGDYDVTDQGRAFAIQHDKGKEYAVLRLTLPVTYEVVL